MFSALAALFSRTTIEERQEEEDEPPSYEEACGAESSRQLENGNASVVEQATFDLIRTDETSVRDEPPAMGQKPSGYQRSKVSLTWVLRGINASHRPAGFHQIERQYEDDHRDRGGRVVGRRPERYPIAEKVESTHCEYVERPRKHTRRKRRPKQSYFGYQIEDIDQFLADASIDRPGNIPVVVIHPSVLYQTQSGKCQTEMDLSLGMVVNAVFKNRQWLYVQTPHGDEGYVLCTSCLPLGILPPTNSKEKSSAMVPRWESSSDLYPQLKGNLTDTEKEVSRRGTRSECGRSRPKFSDCASVSSERAFDRLYLKTKEARSENKSRVLRQTLLAATSDFDGVDFTNTLSVKRGEVVVLVDGENCEWYYVRNRLGEEGFIPATVAGYGYL